VNLAIVLAGSGQFDEAGPLLRQSLREARRSGYRQDVGPLIELVGSQALFEGDAVRAARLFGAGRALNVHGLEIGTLSPNTQFEDDFERELESSLRTELGGEGFETQYALGAELSVSAATELALQRSGPSPRESDQVGT
jgi:hypothetical protein